MNAHRCKVYAHNIKQKLNVCIRFKTHMQCAWVFQFMYSARKKIKELISMIQIKPIDVVHNRIISMKLSFMFICLGPPI